MTGDTAVESDETFTLGLSGATNATIADAEGVGTNTNDDGGSSPPSRQLTVTVAGSGRVTSAPAGIDCGLDCIESYTSGTVVTLTATAEAGATFGGWSGDADCSDGSLTMDAARACTATFNPIPSWTLSVSRAGSGGGTVTSAPAGVDCGAVCAASFLDGTAVTLTATPDANSLFDAWSGDADCTDGSVSMTANRSCAATFTPKPVPTETLSVSRIGIGSGTVTSAPAGIDCGAVCTTKFDTGTVVTLTALPIGTSVFTGWSGDDDCADGSVAMSAGRACTASFGPAPSVTLTVTKAGSGQGTVTSAPAHFLRRHV